MTILRIQWCEPWVEVSDGAARRKLERELKRELAPPHPLFGRSVEAVARRIDRDDVLFAINNGSELAVVHLTWTSSPPDSPPWPAARVFASVDEFVQQCLTPDHADFTDDTPE